MEQKSFGIGMAVASAVWVGLIAMLSCTNPEPEPEPLQGYPCDKLINEARVIAYQQGYFSCLQDVDSTMYIAYLHGRNAVMHIEEQESIDSIVFDLAARYNLDDDKREYLYTLITD